MDMTRCRVGMCLLEASRKPGAPVLFTFNFHGTIVSFSLVNHSLPKTITAALSLSPGARCYVNVGQRPFMTETSQQRLVWLKHFEVLSRPREKSLPPPYVSGASDRSGLRI